MWHSDTKLALQLGLISKQADGVYTLNRDFRRPAPELDPSQKKTLSAIYETFGEQEFSKEMFIATLNYSKSYTSASLHKLTLLRILDQKSTDAGSHYRLLVNPGENPEYFDFVA